MWRRGGGEWQRERRKMRRKRLKGQGAVIRM